MDHILIVDWNLKPRPKQSNILFWDGLLKLCLNVTIYLAVKENEKDEFFFFFLSFDPSQSGVRCVVDARWLFLLWSRLHLRKSECWLCLDEFCVSWSVIFWSCTHLTLFCFCTLCSLAPLCYVMCCTMVLEKWHFIPMYTRHTEEWQ